MTVQAPTRPLSIAVHGIGEHARRTLLPAIERCEALSLAGISTRNADVRAEQAAKWSCQAWSCLDEMLEAAAPDVVYVTTPIGNHYADGLKVLRSGRHLWSEKSFTVTADQAERLIAAAGRGDLAVCVTLAPVHHNQFRMIKMLIGDGEIGQVRHMTGQFAFPHRDRTESIYDPDAGGSALLDVGCYPILIASKLMDEIPEVAGAVMKSEAEYDIDTGGGALLSFSGGATAAVQWGYGRDYVNELRIVGETGTAIAKPAYSKPAHLPPRLIMRRQNADTPLDVPECHQFVEMLDAFAVATREPAGRRLMRKTALEDQRLLAAVAEVAHA